MRLEPYEGKLSRTVLRGLRGSNVSRLPDRDAINLYLSHQDDIPGTRVAITRKLEGRIEAVEQQLQRQNLLLAKIAGFLKRKRENG